MALLKALTPEGLATELQRFPEKLRMSVSRAISDGLIVYEIHHQENEIRRAKTSGSAPIAHRWTSRTGQLAKSFKRYWKLGDLTGYYGSNSKYSRVIEEGGTIKPKGKFLAVPLPGARKAHGHYIWPRDYPEGELFFLQSLKGQPMLAREKGKRKKLEIMFLLRRQVTLDPRRTIERTEKKKSGEVVKLIADAASKPFGGEL